MQREVKIVVGQTGSGKTTWTRGLIKTLSRVLVFDAGFGELCEECFSLDELAARLKSDGGGENGRGLFRLAYTPLGKEYGAMFDLARLCGNLHLVIEEADRLPSPKTLEEYDEIISRGRHWGVSLVAVSLYPAKLPIELRSQASEIIMFRQIEPAHIAYLAETVGAEVAEQLPTLQNFEFIEWHRDGTYQRKFLGGNNESRKNNINSSLERED